MTGNVLRSCKGSVSAALAGLLLAALAAGALSLSLPGCGDTEVSLEYAPDAGVAVITVTQGGGLLFSGDDRCPLFRLQGDGSFIAFEQEGEHGGGIMVRGTLGRVEVTELLRGIAETGFFDLEDEYVDPGVSDATFLSIAVELEKTRKTVTVWTGREVPEFDRACRFILDFPRGETTVYLPDQGYLVVAKYPKEAFAAEDLVEPGSEIYGLLPDAASLARAAESHTAVAIDGAAFLRLKRYDNAQKTCGLKIAQPDGVLVVYPVYEPRAAEVP